VEFLSWDGLRA